MQNVPVAASAAAAGEADISAWHEIRDGGGRNDTLFRQLGRDAHVYDNFEQLLDRAKTLNEQFGEPLETARVVSTAQSVWRMTTEGRNRFGQHGAWFNGAELPELVRDPHLHALLSFLRWKNGPDARFLVANGLKDTSCFDTWSRADFIGARRRAIEEGWIEQIAKPSPGRGALYIWGSKAPGSTAATLVEDSTPESVTVAKLAKGSSRLPESVTVDAFATSGRTP